MKRRHFRLLLEPGLEGAVRLAQLHQYATDLVDGRRMLIAPALSDHIEGLFPARKQTAVLDALVGTAPIGWELEAEGTQAGQCIAIRSQGPGVAISAIMRILEQIAPEALSAQMIYEPMHESKTDERARSLH
ncbi:hypothetical protein [Erythrobacter sp. CCH5-A1]|jgi:hypothetical protein|uniref:hypothetical protein n=1 Tax=Erythrobacter sp. CCH5-A1 TaxID=1768792 RepID=UPI0008376453|nr:hypothetical protein [Erythrobacter sp. CCH5-A1]